MEKAEYEVAEPGVWWLLIPDYSIIEEPRKNLGAALGSTDLQWYLQLDNLRELYKQVEPSYDLMKQLDNATDDDKRVEWLADMTEALLPDEEPPKSDASPSANADVAITPTQQSPAAKKEAPSAFPKNASPFSERGDVSPVDPDAGVAPPKPADLEAIAKDVAADFGNRSDLATQLGISEDELKDILSDLPADFEGRVAAEAARIAAEA